MIKTSIRVAAVTISVGAVLAAGAGAASAFTVAPIPGGNKIDLNRGETVALGNAHIVAPVLNAVYPIRFESGRLLGDGAQRVLDLAAAAGGTAAAVVLGPIHAPTAIDLYYYSFN